MRLVGKADDHSNSAHAMSVCMNGKHMTSSFLPLSSLNIRAREFM